MAIEPVRNNAFDIIRIHKFGDLDDKKSFTAMSEFAVQDDEVKKQLALERKEAAEREFGTTDWETLLELDKNGKIKEMPKPDEILSAKQKDGTTLKAAEIYERVWKWLDRIKATAYVSPQQIEQYAMCKARWLQCEEMTNELGFLSRHPTTNKPITSPFINIGINYLNQATRQWDAIMQTIKENCSVDFSGANPNDDLEKILHQRKGF